MNTQKIIKTLLLLFVAISLLIVVFKPEKPVTKTPEITGKETQSPAQPTHKTENPEKTLIVSYFHGSARCVSCRTIEAFTAEAVQKHFAPRLKSGEVKWQEINIQTPENNHYVGKYKLFTQSVILSLQKNGDEIKWKNLDRVWRLISNREQFHDYIRTEMEAMLTEKEL